MYNESSLSGIIILQASGSVKVRDEISVGTY